MLLQQPDKVGVFAHDDDVCTAGRGEDFRIRRTLKAQITNRQALNGDRRAEEFQRITQLLFRYSF